MQTNEKEQTNTNEKLEKRIRHDRIIKIILIIIIIILLLLLYWLIWKIGKIGYNTNETSVYPSNTDSSANDDEKMVFITITDDDIEWDKDTELDIFSNEKFNRRKYDCTRVIRNI